MLLVSRPFSLPSVRRGTALAAVVAASALAGCASTDDTATKQTKTLTGEAGTVQTVVADLAKRASKKVPDSAGICSKDLSAAAQEAFSKIGGGTCAAGVSKVLSQTDYLPLNVKSVAITGAGDTTATTPAGTSPKSTTPASTTPASTAPTGPQQAVAEVDTPDDIGTRKVILIRASAKDDWKIDRFSAALTAKAKK